VTGDFNGDVKLDLATSSFSTLSILLGVGNGKFAQGAANAVEGNPYLATALVAADFNRDGKLDVALVALNSSGTQMIAVMLGNGHAATDFPETRSDR